MTPFRNKLAKLFGGNVSAMVSAQSALGRHSFPVRAQYTPEMEVTHDAMISHMRQEVGAPEPFGVGQAEVAVHDTHVQATYHAGYQAASGLSKMLPHPPNKLRGTGIVAGSGNDIEQAMSMAQTSGNGDSVQLGTTSGGWLQNITRMLTMARPDQGTSNAAFLSGMASHLRNSNGINMRLASFSQGATAMRDAQDAMSSTQMQEQQTVDHFSMGGAAFLRSQHTVMTGLDPVPLAAIISEPFRPTSSGQKQGSFSLNGHNGMAYSRLLAKLRDENPK